MGAPTTGSLDTFNRANSTGLGSNYTNNIFGYGGTMLDVDSNMAAPLSESYGEQWWNVAQYGPDSEVWATVGSLTHVGGDMGLSWCVQTPGSAAADGYRIVYNRLAGTDTVKLFKVTNGANPGTQLGSTANQEIAVGDKLFGEKIGSALKVYYSAAGSGIWTQIISATDATYGTGFVGLYSFANAGAGRWDEFGGGTVAAGDATVTGVPATGLGDFPAPGVTADSALTSPAASGLGDFPAPTASGANDGTVTGVPADGLGDFPAPGVTADSAVTAPPADGLGDFPASGMDISSTVDTGPASGLGDFPAPAVAGTGDGTVTGVPADGLGDFPAPATTADSAVTGVPADGSGDFPAPGSAAGATVTSDPMDATGDFPAPGATGGVGTAPTPDTPTSLALDAHIAGASLDAHAVVVMLDDVDNSVALAAHATSVTLDAHRSSITLDS